jgi:hypothetical protein
VAVHLACGWKPGRGQDTPTGSEGPVRLGLGSIRVRCANLGRHRTSKPAYRLAGRLPAPWPGRVRAGVRRTQYVGEHNRHRVQGDHATRRGSYSQGVTAGLLSSAQRTHTGLTGPLWGLIRYGNAVFDLRTGCSSELRKGDHADADDDEVARDRLPVASPHSGDRPRPFERRDPRLHPHLHSVRLVHASVEGAELLTEHTLERHRGRLDNGDVEAALAS